VIKKGKKRVLGQAKKKNHTPSKKKGKRKEDDYSSIGRGGPNPDGGRTLQKKEMRAEHR